MTQLSLAMLPVAAPDLLASHEHERRLSQLLDAVCTVLDDDGQSAPTTRVIAEHFEGESVAPGSEPFVLAESGLSELQRRGCVVGIEDSPGYFARDDDGPTVTRWVTRRAAL